MDGFLIVDKPSGISSHGVVARVRRSVGRTRVGHAGTLDPLATGVLVVCLGAATRLAEWAAGADKRYRAQITLGVETTTDDAEGAVVARGAVDVTPDDLELALAAFRGPIEQRPPAFSAIKVGGQPLYRRARAGESIETPTRRVDVHCLRLVQWSMPVVTIDLTCSKGTYVRAIARDLGRRLGCGAHLSALRRTASGDFTIDEAIALDEAAERLDAGAAAALLQPLERAVGFMARVDLDAARLEHVRHGRAFAASVDDPPVADRQPVRLHGPDGGLVAIGRRVGDLWQPEKVLLAEPRP